MFPFMFHVLRTLGTGAATNRENMKPVGAFVSNGLNYSWI